MSISHDCIAIVYGAQSLKSERHRFLHSAVDAISEVDSIAVTLAPAYVHPKHMTWIGVKLRGM